MNASLRALAVLVAVGAASRGFAQCPPDPSTTTPDDLTCYVSKTGNDANPGTSASPMLTIQAALDRVFAGFPTAEVIQSVRVLPGTYQECPYLGSDGEDTAGDPGDVDIVADDFLVRNVNSTTIVDATGVKGCVGFPTVELGDNASLRGFTIKGGGNSGVSAYGHVWIANNVIIDNVSPTLGGGIYVRTGINVSEFRDETLIEHNSILNNTSTLSGGGIYVSAEGDGLPSKVVIDSNTISGNTAGDATSNIFGGGVTVFTDSFVVTDQSTVTITNNTIEENEAKGADATHASYGGGVFVATFGAGAETIEIKSTNLIRNNKATHGYGGGIAALGQALFGGGIDHSVIVEGNSVSGNTAEFGGGGVYALNQPLTITAADALDVQVRANEIAGNSVTGVAGAPGVTGGGGIFAEFFNEQTIGDNKSLIVSGNSLRNNTSQSYGGGAALWVQSFGESDSVTAAPGRLPASSRVRFTNNLVTGNSALDTQTGGHLGEGGGVYLRTFGQAGGASAIDFKFNTVAGNTADTGMAGGVAILSSNFDGPTNAGIGSSAIDVSNSIIVSNSGFAVGGSALPGVDNTTVRIAYNDTFDNGAAPFAPQYLVTAGPGNLTVNPELDSFFVPLLCSPTVDAADPAEAFQEERKPSGERANLGHTGLTPNATITLPDITGDGLVDGVDILRLAVAFGSQISQVGRYNPAADIDNDGLIDGEDLSFVAAWFGKGCP